MADPRHPRHYEESFKRRIVRLYENGKPAREIKCVLSSCYRPVWREFSFRKSGRF